MAQVSETSNQVLKLSGEIMVQILHVTGARSFTNAWGMASVGATGWSVRWIMKNGLFDIIRMLIASGLMSAKCCALLRVPEILCRQGDIVLGLAREKDFMEVRVIKNQGFS
jgi:hypothetical protein